MSTALPDRAVKALPMKEGALVFVTLGPKGASAYRNGAKFADAAGFDVRTVETTGCGDWFMAAILATRVGAAEADPTRQEVASS